MLKIHDSWIMNTAKKKSFSHRTLTPTWEGIVKDSDVQSFLDRMCIESILVRLVIKLYSYHDFSISHKELLAYLTAHFMTFLFPKRVVPSWRLKLISMHCPTSFSTNFLTSHIDFTQSNRRFREISMKN